MIDKNNGTNRNANLFLKIYRRNPTHDLFLASIETMYMLNEALV